MSQVTNKAYIDFLITLRDVCKESNSPLQNESVITNYADSTAIREAMESLPPHSLKDVAEKVKTFVKDKQEFTAVDNVHLVVNQGELVSFLGPSG